jgi:hypothetical protein
VTRSLALRGSLCGLAILLGSGGGVGAQLTDPRVGAGVRLETYSFGDAEQVNLEKIQLLTFPVSARVLHTGGAMCARRGATDWACQEQLPPSLPPRCELPSSGGSWGLPVSSLAPQGSR